MHWIVAKLVFPIIVGGGFIGGLVVRFIFLLFLRRFGRRFRNLI